MPGFVDDREGLDCRIVEPPAGPDEFRRAWLAAAEDDDRSEPTMLDDDPRITVEVDEDPPTKKRRRTRHKRPRGPESLQVAARFEQLDGALKRLEQGWSEAAPRARIAMLLADFREFMRTLLEELVLVPVWTRSAEASPLVHDTYVRLITVGGILREALDDRWAPPLDLQIAYGYCEALLDEMVPFVGLADRAMRRICLDGNTLEEALQWLTHQLDEEAADRLREAQSYVQRIREDLDN
ncbi:MAG: hypothetical protein QM831_00255 [Kofleriaceae bacterium]